MATVYSRAKKSGGVTWYTKIKQPDGSWKPVALKGVTTGPGARKLAHEIAQQQERAHHGLDTSTLFLGTFADLCAWAWSVHFKNLRGSQPDGSRLRCHVGDPTAKVVTPSTWLGALPARKVTSGKLAEYLAEVANAVTVRGSLPSGGHVNRLRALFSSVFTLAIEHGKWAGPNPAEKTATRPMVEREHDILTADEVGPVLAEVSPYWRGVFAVGLLAGLRRGEIFALEHRDVDLVRRTLRVRRSHDANTTKGGRSRTVPISEDLVQFLEPWLDLPGPILFPGKDGQRRSPDVHLELRLRAAMIRAGIVDHYDHKCRRSGCGHVEQHPTDDKHDCPTCGFRLWPVARARKISFHDTRHTFASHALMSGAETVSVQKMLGHRDPKLTTNTYGHLSTDYLASEVNRVRLPGLARAVTNAADAERALPKGAQECEPTSESAHSASAGRGAPVVHGGEMRMVSNGADVMIGQEKSGGSEWSRRGLNSRPMRCERNGETFATLGPVEQPSQTVDIVSATDRPVGQDTAPLGSSLEPRGASMVHGGRPVHHGSHNAKAEGAGRIAARVSTSAAADLLTVPVVARRLGVSAAWVYRTIEKGEIPCVRLGQSRQIRIASADLDAYLERFPGIDPPVTPPARPEPVATPVRASKGVA